MKSSDAPASGSVLDRKLLELFIAAGDGFVSGETISRELQVSRTAVWKRVGVLRELGCRISSVPSRGYRLDEPPDLLLSSIITAGLRTKRLGTKIISFLKTVSTNTIASRLAEEGEPEGTVVVAEAQEQGKGRMGRRWESPAGVNLYLSVVLRPSVPPMEAPRLTFLSAVAVARAAAVAGFSPRIKWPNDILLNGRKFAGLLNEMNAETDRIHHVILGIGVNLNMTAEQFPPDLRHPATSLMIEGGRPVDRVAFTQNLLMELDRLYEQYLDGGFVGIRTEWLSLLEARGRKVTVDYGAGTVITGTVSGIDDEGSLLVEREDGGLERVLSGDVKLID